MEQPLPDSIRTSLLGTGERPQPVSKEFRTRCYTAARGTGGRTVGWDPPSFGFLKSFTATVFQFSKASGRESASISQALQETHLTMNEQGARAKIAVSLGIRVSSGT